jgi:CHASE2 domain-containing sensor protein
MSRRERVDRRRLIALGLVALASAAIAGLFDATGILAPLERATISSRFALRQVPKPTDIVIVRIDDRTFGELGRQWPFPRSWHGRVVDRLRAAGAREIVLDVQFTEPTTPVQDLALYDAISAAGNVTLATSQSDAHGRTNVLGGDANLARAHARAGAANLTTSAGGVVTRFPRTVSGLESLAVVAAERATRVALDGSRFQGGGAWIDYRGGVGSFPSVSYGSVLRGHVPARTFRGKVVVVGATAPTLQDVHATPLGGDLMSGPEVQANAIWTAMHGNPLRSAPGWLVLITIALAALVAPLTALRLSVVRSVIVVAGAAGSYLFAAQLAFDSDTIVTVTYPLVALGLGAVGMVSASYITASADRSLLGWTVRRRTEQLRDVQLEIVTRLVQAAETRDSETGQHIERIGRLCERLARRLGMDAAHARMLGRASTMHDVGKIGIPDRVLLKPGALDEDEWEVMKSHTSKGAEILAGSTSPLVQMAEEIARTHHERWDGSGYPEGLRGDAIPLSGRICAICDVFDALISKRPYKEPWPRRSALDEIAAGSGSQFDPALVVAFLEMVHDVELEPIATDGDAVDIASLPALGAPGHTRSRAGSPR